MGLYFMGLYFMGALFYEDFIEYFRTVTNFSHSVTQVPNLRQQKYQYPTCVPEAVTEFLHELRE